MARHSPEKLLELFNSNETVEFKDIQSTLDNASRATCFRYLQRVPYHRSYNYNGRYYTRKNPTRYDRFGLFSYGDVFFSRDNALGETIRRLVWESQAGWTQRELQDVLRVRMQVVLLSTFHQGKVDREKVHSFYVHLHPDPQVRGAQLNRRRERAVLEVSAKEGEPRTAELAAPTCATCWLVSSGNGSSDGRGRRVFSLYRVYRRGRTMPGLRQSGAGPKKRLVSPLFP